MVSEKSVVLLTGGTSGIGSAAVKRFRDSGWRVYEISRRAAGGDGTPEITHIQGDLTKIETLKAAVERVVEAEGRIDALVNNAGFGIFGAAETTNMDDVRRQFEVNFFGTVALTQLVLPIMRRQGGGRIINVASCAAFFPLPYQSYYSATKAALLTWARAMAGEVRQFGVEVVTICPGDINTEFGKARIIGGERTAEEARALQKAEASEKGGMAPVVVAKEIVRFANCNVVKRVPLVAIPGLKYAWLDRAARLLPRTWVSRLIEKWYV